MIICDGVSTLISVNLGRVECSLPHSINSHKTKTDSIYWVSMIIWSDVEKIHGITKKLSAAPNVSMRIISFVRKLSPLQESNVRKESHEIRGRQIKIECLAGVCKNRSWNAEKDIDRQRASSRNPTFIFLNHLLTCTSGAEKRQCNLDKQQDCDWDKHKHGAGCFWSGTNQTVSVLNQSV